MNRPEKFVYVAAAVGCSMVLYAMISTIPEQASNEKGVTVTSETDSPEPLVSETYTREPIPGFAPTAGTFDPSRGFEPVPAAPEAPVAPDVPVTAPETPAELPTTDPATESPGPSPLCATDMTGGFPCDETQTPEPDDSETPSVELQESRLEDVR